MGLGINFAQTLLVILHIAASGIGFVILTRKLGFSPTGQTISGLTYSLSSFQITRISFLSINAALAWLPWLLIASLGIIEGVRDGKKSIQKRNMLGLIFASTCLLLSGHAQIAWYSYLLLGIWILFWIIPIDNIKSILTILVKIGASLVFSIGITMVQLLPTLEYLQQSQRASAVDYAYALNYSFWPWRFLTLISANLFGNPGNGNYWVSADNYWEDAIYVGVLPIILCIFTVFFFFIRRIRLGSVGKKIFWYTIFIVLIGIIFALGKFTPVFPWLYYNIPTFSMFQGPARWILWPVVGFALLAGMAFDQWQKPTGKWLYWSRLSLAGAAAIMIGSLLVVKVTGQSIQATYMKSFAETGALLLGAAILNLIKPGEKSKRIWWNYLVVLLVFVDLMYINWHANPGISNYSLLNFEKQLGEHSERYFMNNLSAEKLVYKKYFRFNTYDLHSIWAEIHKEIMPNTNLYRGFSMFNNFDPLLPANFVDWSEQTKLQSKSPDIDLLRLSDVGVVIEVNGDEELSTTTKIINGATRYRFFTCWQSVPGNGNIHKEFSDIVEDGLALSKVLISGSGIAPSCNISNEPVQFIVIDEKPDSTVLEIYTPANGWIMQADTKYPGWIAEVDDQPTKIYLADGIFRGIYVEAGNHILKISYRPSTLYNGALISLLFLFIYIGWAIFPEK